MISQQRQLFGVFRLFFSTVFLLSFSSLSAQIEMKTDRNNANYELGETALFEITSSQSGTVFYLFKYDNNTPVISSGTVDIVSGETISIPFLGMNPEVVICEATLNNNKKTSAAVFSANYIPTLSEEPEDFDVFWSDQLALARQIDLDTEISYYSEDENVTSYRINIAIPDNRRMYGYITVPKEGDDFPAMITLPAHGSYANVASPEELISNLTNAISVSLSIHNAEADAVDLNAYSPNDISSRDDYYYRYAILGTVRIIDYLFTREDFDAQNLCLTGASQGGGLSLIVAGLDDRVKAISISNPALSRHGAYDTDKATGFPYFQYTSSIQFATPEHLGLTAEASKYYDAIFFAKRFDGNALVNISYNDLVTPAATAFAAVKELRGKTIVTHSTILEHTHPEQYWSGRFDFWRKNFLAMSNPPYFINTGYWIEAGADENTEVGASVGLNAQIFYNEETNTSFPVKWETIDGPGLVYFSDANIANPTASFVEAGVYTLKVTATDESQLEESDFFHTISDFLLIEVTEHENPQGDLIQPTCLLSFLEFDTNGNALIHIEFSEPIVGLEATDFYVNNGNVISVVEGEIGYILMIEPILEGDLVVSLPTGSVIDIAGNVNVSSNEISILIEFIDNIPPNCTLSFSEINSDGNIVVNVLFSENVTGLESSDFAITNGEIVDLTGSNNAYVLLVMPLASGDVVVSLPDNSAADAAANGNLASNEISVFINITSTFNTITNHVDIYPNPAYSVFYLTLEKYIGKSAKVRIYNELGQLFKSIQLNGISNEPFAMKTDGMLAGVYFITLELPEGVLITRKIVII